MEKLVYVLFRDPSLSEADFATTLLGQVAKGLVECGVRGLTFNLADADVAYAQGVRLTRLDPPPSGLASFWLLGIVLGTVVLVPRASARSIDIVSQNVLTPERRVMVVVCTSNMALSSRRGHPLLFFAGLSL